LHFESNFIELFIEFGWSSQSSILHDHLLTVGILEEFLIVISAEVDVRHIFLIKPFNALAVFPKAELDFLFFRYVVCAEPMLFTLPPIAFIASAVSPSVDTETMLLIIFVLTFILSAIVPHVIAETFHVVAFPLAFVLSAVKPGVDACSRNLVFLPLSNVLRTIIPLVLADAVLASEGILSLISAAIGPSFNTFPVLEIISPHTLIFCSINMLVHSEPVCLIVCPLAILILPSRHGTLLSILRSTQLHS
jgi:hypothetical protein